MIGAGRDAVGDELARHIVDNLAEGCQLIGFDWTYLYVNESAVTQSRQTRAQLLGRTMMECYPGIDGTEIFSVLRQCMSERVHDRMESRFTFPDGSVGWFELRFVPVPEGACILSLDISDRKRSAEALRGSKEELAITLDSIGDAVIATDVAGHVVRMNPTAERLTGWSLEEAVGRSLGEVFRILNADTGATVEGPVRRVVRDGVVVGLADHTILVSRDGTEHPIADSGAPIRDDEGRIRGVVLVFRDMTREAAAEKLLRDREEMFRGVLEAAPDAVVIVDARGHIEFLNVQTERLFGYPRAELIGKSVDVLIPSRFHGRHEKHVEGFLGSTEARPMGAKLELAGRRRDGTEFPVEVALSPMSSAKGMLVTATIRDVTERKAVEAARAAAEAQLFASDRMASVGILAAGVAHEINNPLAAVIANLDLALQHVSDMATRANLPEDLRDELQDARECADRIHTIVRDLKIFSRVEEETRNPVDTKHVLDSTLRMVWNEIRHRAQVIKHYGDVPRVEANESRLGQVFLNLIVNAAHAIPEGRAEANQIRVSTRLDVGGDVIVEIADTGSGMSPEVQRQIFTPFFTTKPIGEGTGLGLAICRRIVTELGGRLELESAVGKGTVFRVHLPKARSSEAPRPKATISDAPAAPRRGRVLVVDDEPKLTAVIRRCLVAAHEVVTTTYAQEALDLIAAGERFDVIFCDLMMPDVTGMDVYDELKRTAPEQAEHMIFMTGGAFTARAREFLERVPNQRLNKPFDPPQLRALVNERVS